MFGTPDRSGGIGRDDLGGHEPVEEHADGGEVLLDSGGGAGMSLDIDGDGHRLDLAEREGTCLAPAEKLAHGLGVGGPGVGL